MDMYEKSITDNNYTYKKNYSFKIKVNDVKIVATRNIENGKLLKTLCGQTVTIKPENIKVCFALLKLPIFKFLFCFLILQEGINDFSIMKSSRNKKDLLFLGPAAYINHSCTPNTNWHLLRESTWTTWCAKAIKYIKKGEETTADYGNDFFGINNIRVYCECESCKENDKGMHTT